jgi:hypothetical protein
MFIWLFPFYNLSEKNADELEGTKFTEGKTEPVYE